MRRETRCAIERGCLTTYGFLPREAAAKWTGAAYFPPGAADAALRDRKNKEDAERRVDPVIATLHVLGEFDKEGEALGVT